MRHIDSALERLTNVTEALLTLARVQSGGQIMRRIVPLEPLIDRVVRARKNVHVDCAPGVAAVTDERLLVEALSNVVDNAGRHGGDGPVELSAVFAGSHVRIAVTDHGPGVPADQRAAVLERFHGAGPRSGLGLAIVNEAMTALGGTVTLGDAVGGGLVVALELPGARLL